jgi:hypothetical protein
VGGHDGTDALGRIGNLATVGDNIANAAAHVEGLYREFSATQALFNNGVALAVKDGVNLGSVFAPARLRRPGRVAGCVLAAGSVLKWCAAGVRANDP